MLPIYKRNIAACIILTIITCGIYGIYWYYLLVKNVKAAESDDSRCTGEVLCLILVPFYAIYWWYTRGKTVKDRFDQYGYSAHGSHIVYAILALFGLAIVSMAMMQNDFNSLPCDRTQSIRRSAPKLLYAFLAVFMICSIVFPSAFAGSDEEIYDPETFAGKKIGVQTGSIYVDLVSELIDDPEPVYFSTSPDMLTALKSGKIDAFIHDEPNIRYLASQSSGVTVKALEGATDYLAPVFPKTEEGKTLSEDMSDFILRLKDSGELQALEEKWFNGSEEEQVMENYENYPDTNGVITIATDATYAPFQFVVDGKIVGYEIEIVALFCKEQGYRPEFVNCDFSGIIAGISSGRFDIGASGFSITEERKESVYFSEPILESHSGIAFLDEGTAADSSVIESFKKTFIVEDRWKDFLSGALITLEITICSILAGTALGFAWYLLYRRNSRPVVAISNALIWIINGMPTVVLLMVLFYIVFGSSTMNGTIISIIGFSLLFASFTMETMKAGENTVDRGQYLAVEALGYENTQAFFRIIFPQAVKHIWPAYISQISSHIKATSVVGYIAVVDITKVGDLIRGRTYDAFFPLISVAISYFVMTAILQRIARFIEKKTDPYRRTEEEILGGAVIK